MGNSVNLVICFSLFSHDFRSVAGRGIGVSMRRLLVFLIVTREFDDCFLYPRIHHQLVSSLRVIITTIDSAMPHGASGLSVYSIHRFQSWS
jgi:hypothetical protein